MAAPEGIKWGSVVGDYCRIGIYTSQTSTNTETTVTVEVWFWSKFSVTDSDSNNLYLDNLATTGSATTDKGGTNIATKSDSGGWSTANQVKLTGKSYTYKHTRGTADTTRYIYAKLTGINKVSGTAMYAETTVTIPALNQYYLDVGIDIDGVWHHTGNGTVALFNLYLNGSTTPTKEQVADIYVPLPYGTEYEVKLAWLSNGYECTSDTSVYGTITEETDVAFSFVQLGLCKIHNGTSCEDHLAHIKDGDSYAVYIPYVYNGTSWEPYNG